MLSFKTRSLCCLVLLTLVRAPAFGAELPLRDGAHVSLLGNGLAEGFQRDGWLETLFQARFPDRHLSFRNLGFNGDEVKQRMRCENFGTPDDWLTRTKTDVVFAFFGYNESFGGPAGLEEFKQNLSAFVKQTQEHKYNGNEAARVVLFSPIAHENLRDPNFPDGSANNKNLRLYTDAIKQVATQSGVPVVDLFTTSLELYASARSPLTTDGIHLNDSGHRLIAEAILQALSPGKAASPLSDQQIESLRTTVMNKDFFWYNRYRTVDGYNVYGGRSQLKYVDNVSNWDVLQREMEVLDVMTANRDKRIWAVAQGNDLEVDDSNTPPFIPVKTNKPGRARTANTSSSTDEEAIRT